MRLEAMRLEAMPKKSHDENVVVVATRAGQAVRGIDAANRCDNFHPELE